MPTLDAMVDEVLGHLRAYSSDQERKTYLTSSLSSSATAIPMADTQFVSEGLIEVDEELVELANVDQLSSTATAFPWGRGAAGSTAVAHPANTRVTIAPRWPRFSVKQRINEIIVGLWPDLFAVRTDVTQLSSFTQLTYSLPATARGILDIRWQTEGGSPDYWVGVRQWRMEPSADTSLYPTGVTVDIGEGMSTGRKIKFIYKAEPAAMTDGADDFAATTGLAVSCSDLVCLAAAARLVTSAELARSQTFTVEHSERVAGQQSGSAIAASKYLMQLYQVRLAQERDRLFERYPIRLQRTWT